MMYRMMFFLLVFCHLVMKSSLMLCEIQSFTVAYMTNAGGQCPTTQSLLLYIAASEEVANCSISAPKATTVFSSTTLIVEANDVVEVNLPTTLQLSGSGVEQKGILVSCNTTVTVYGVNTCQACTDGFSVIPNSHLGNEYIAFTALPSRIDFNSQVAVVSYLDNTKVCVRLPSCSNCQVTISGIIYGPGSYIFQSLNAYETLQIQSNGNLVGTYISSNNPVAVYSGDDKSSVDSGIQDHLVTEVPPLKFWGKHFIAVQTSHDAALLFIMAGTDNVSLNISCTESTIIQTNIVSAGDIYQKLLSADEYCFIDANHPVFVVQLKQADASLLPLTPIDRYSSNYSFIPPNSANVIDNYFIYVIDESAAAYITLDSFQIGSPNSKPIPGTSLIGGYFQVTDGLHHVTNPYSSFNGVLLSLNSAESIAISLGWNWKATPQISNTPYQSLTLGTICQLPTTLQNADSTSDFTTSTMDKGSTLTGSITTTQDSPVCTKQLQGSYFVDLTQGYYGFDIIAERLMKSIFQCAFECRRQDLCKSFQFNTQTGSCFLLRIGGNTLDPMNGQIFTLEC